MFQSAFQISWQTHESYRKSTSKPEGPTQEMKMRQKRLKPGRNGHDTGVSENNTVHN